MSEEKNNRTAEELSAEALKAAISDRGEKALAEILETLRGFKSGLSQASGAQTGAKESREREIGPEAGREAGERGAVGVETVEYRAPGIVRAAENAIAEGSAHKSPRERREELRARTAQRHGSALFGKSRAEQFEIIRKLSDECAEELPERFYEKLSGGIALSEAKKYHPRSQNERPLLILGEYRNDHQLGRSIMLYGGSIIATYAHLCEQELKNELRRIIRHEFTHHIESLCGERGLEIEDEMNLEQYEWELSSSEDPDAR